MAVTLPRDEGCSEPTGLGASFVLSGRSNMQEDARDSLEVFKFNLIEETIGHWLRAVIQRLEEQKELLPSCRLRAKRLNTVLSFADRGGEV
jgi:hypothetical protein